MDTKQQKSKKDPVENIHEWAVEVGGSEEKGEEILGNEHEDMPAFATRVLDLPENDAAAGTATIVDPCAEMDMPEEEIKDDSNCLHVVQFD